MRDKRGLILEGLGEGKLNDRLGRCFELSTKYVMSHPDWNLINAVISDKRFGSDNTLAHAWCEKGEMAYDPVLDKEWPIQVMYSLYGVVDYKYNPYKKKVGVPETLKVTYTSAEMYKLVTKFGTYGPWDKKITGFKDRINKKKVSDNNESK
jgi:hypothetical protein